MPDEETHRRPHTNVRLTDPVHARLKDHTREGETLSGTVGRALDALEREDELPNAITEVMERRGGSHVDHYEWNGALYCEETHSQFEWANENPLTAPDECPYCGKQLRDETVAMEASDE